MGKNTRRNLIKSRKRHHRRSTQKHLNVCMYAKMAGFNPYGYIYTFIESNKLYESQQIKFFENQQIKFFENQQIKFIFLDVDTIAKLSVQAYNLIRSKPELIRPITAVSKNKNNKSNNNNNNNNKNTNNL